MYSHLNENMFPAKLCFHLPRKDGLYQPIAFAFVTETMYRDIINERLNLLAALSFEVHARQEKLFKRYDPERSLNGFKAILKMVCMP